MGKSSIGLEAEGVLGWEGIKLNCDTYKTPEGFWCPKAEKSAWMVGQRSGSVL